MFRTITSSTACALVVAAAAQSSVTGSSGRATINFATASWLIDAEAEARISDLCARIAADAPERVVLMGHTDARGSMEYNIGLSQRRTEAVRAALQACAPGVAFELAWQGEQAPLLPASEGDDVLANRRVEVEWEGSSGDDLGTNTSLYAPLIPGAAVPFQCTAVDASQPVCWTTAEGVTVRIDAGAIVDADGKPVQGQVDLAFRAFTDPWQTVASGIPMHVRTASGVEHMESAYMVELLATQGGRPLQLAEGERIEYDLPSSVEVAPDFNTWTIDESTGGWVDNGAFAVDSTTTAGTSAAVTRYMDRYNYRWRDRDRDTSRFVERAEAGNYCGTNACMPGTKPYDRRKGNIVPPGWSRVAVSIELLPGRQTYHMKQGFRLRWHSSAIDYKEWRAFPKKMHWAYDGPLTRKELSKQFVRKHYYQDVRLVHDDKTGQITIRLKDRGKWIDLPVDVAQAEASLKDAGGLQACLSEYDKALAVRQQQFDERMAARAQQIRTEDQQHRQYAYSSAKPIMTSTEADIERSAFHAHAVREHAREMAGMFRQGNDQLQQALFANGFGLCNIDRLISYDRVQQMIARFEDEKGEPFKWTAAYAISNQRNAVVTLWGNGTEEQDLSVAPGRMDWLILADDAGHVAMVEGKHLRKTDGVLVVPCRSLDEETSMDDLVAMTGQVTPTAGAGR